MSDGTRSLALIGFGAFFALVGLSNMRHPAALAQRSAAFFQRPARPEGVPPGAVRLIRALSWIALLCGGALVAAGVVVALAA